MAVDSTEIRVGTTGNLYVAAFGTAAPADPPTAWGASWLDLGALSEDGASFTPSTDVNEIRIWQSAYAAKRIVTGRGLEWKVVLMQRNADTFKLAMGGGTIAETSTGSGVWKWSPPSASALDERAFGLEVREGSITDRYYLRRGMVTAVSDVTFRRSEAARFELTITALGDDVSDAWNLISNDAAMNPA
jgi:hypothetical protein